MTEQPQGPLDAHTEEQLADAGGEFEPDFTDQSDLRDPSEASGANSSGDDDPAAEGDAVYTPPIDPVVKTDTHGRAEILGGFGAEDDSFVERSASDGRLGDEALADAVRLRLAEDTATNDLPIIHAVRNGDDHLSFTVTHIVYTDNSTTVA